MRDYIAARQWTNGHDHDHKLKLLSRYDIPHLKQLAFDLDEVQKDLQNRANEALYVRVMCVTLLRQNGEYP